MLQFLNSWASALIVAIIVGTILEMILPENTNKKYVKVVIGLFILFTIISPVISKLAGNINFNIEDYEKYMTSSKETYIEIPTSVTPITGEATIQKLYLANLQTEIKIAIENLDYTVNSIDIKLEGGETYGNIERLTLNVKPKNKVEIVERVDINVGENNAQSQTKEKLSQEDIKIIKDFLYINYGIKKESVNYV